jgi:hypothetical protein
LFLCAIDPTRRDSLLEHLLLSANAISGENERVLGQMMKRFDMGLWLAVCFAAMIWGTVANAEPGTIPVMGSGRESCGRLIAAIGGNDPPGPGEEIIIETKRGVFFGEYKKYQEWLMGFVAGFNADQPGREYTVHGIDLAGMDLWMRNWCNQHPTETVFTGAVAFINEMRTNAAARR